MEEPQLGALVEAYLCLWEGKSETLTGWAAVYMSVWVRFLDIDRRVPRDSQALAVSIRL